MLKKLENIFFLSFNFKIRKTIIFSSLLIRFRFQDFVVNQV